MRMEEAMGEWWQEIAGAAVALWLGALTFFGKRHLDADDKTAEKVATLEREKLSREEFRDEFRELMDRLEKRDEEAREGRKALYDKIDAHTKAQTDFNLTIVREMGLKANR